MSTSDLITIGVAVFTTGSAYWLARRTERAKASATEELLSKAIDRIDANYRSEIDWLRSQNQDKESS